MSQDKNEQKQPAAGAGRSVEEVKTEQTAAPAEEQTTFTVTKEQMEKMEGLSKLVSDVNDKYLRLAAEYDNYRKRTTREKENAYADAKADTIKPFLDVLDNLERGTQQFEEGDPHRQGMERSQAVFRRARKARRGADSRAGSALRSSRSTTPSCTSRTRASARTPS